MRSRIRTETSEAITPIPTENMGHAFKVDLDETGPTFYVKFSNPYRNKIADFSGLEDLKQRKKFTVNIFERKFLLLELLNLLGLKTPTELALIEHKNGSILLTLQSLRGQEYLGHSLSNQVRINY